MLLSRSQLIREIEETREKLRELEETRGKLRELEEALESYKVKKFRVVLDVETNPNDWGCKEDNIAGVLKSYINESLAEIKELAQLNDPDDEMTLKGIYEIDD